MSTMSLHNREVAVANAICHDRNVKRAYEIHNAKINAVHSTSTLAGVPVLCFRRCIDVVYEQDARGVRIDVGLSFESVLEKNLLQPTHHLRLS